MVAGGGSVHAQRHEDPLLQKVIPGSMGSGADDLTGGGVDKIVIAVTCTMLRGLRKVSHPTHELLPVERRCDPHIVMGRHARSVCKHVANRDLLRREGVGNPKPRQVAHRGIVPVDNTLIDQHPQGGCGECLRGGGYCEKRVLVDRIGLCQRPDAESAGVDDAVSLNYRDCKAGLLPRFHGSFDVRIEPVEQMRLSADRGRTENAQDQPSDCCESFTDESGVRRMHCTRDLYGVAYSNILKQKTYARVSRG